MPTPRPKTSRIELTEGRFRQILANLGWSADQAMAKHAHAVLVRGERQNSVAEAANVTPQAVGQAVRFFRKAGTLTPRK